MTPTRMQVFNHTVEATFDDEQGGTQCTAPFMRFLMDAMRGSIPADLTLAQAEEWAKTAHYKLTIHAEFQVVEGK